MIDLVLLAVTGLSALLGLFRGFIGIVVGTASWVLAGWAAFQFGSDTAHWLAEGAAPSTTQYVGGYVLTFVVVMVGVAAIGMLIRAGVNAVRLGGVDRMAGFGLGVLRGLVLCCVLVLLMGFTPLAHDTAWTQSRMVPVLLPGAQWMRDQLPDWSVADVDLGKLPVTGDNGVLDAVVSGAMQARQDTGAEDHPPGGEAAAAAPAPEAGLPQNIDPAQVRAGDPAPDRGGSNGQARPPSN